MAGNPSSVHRYGRRARQIIEDAREKVAALVEVDPSWVVFTSGGTEANALALAATTSASVLVSAVEHPSVGDGIAVSGRIPVDGDGVVRVEALDALLRTVPAPALVSVMLANNETGVIQPVAKIARTAVARGAIVHCDAVQAAGKIPVRFAALGVHMLSLSAHKLGGPPGVGALITDPTVPFAPVLRGGGQERRRRAGTENIAGIAGFGVAAEIAADLADAARLAHLRDAIEQRVRSICPATPIFGCGAPRLPNTTCLAMPDVPAETQVIAFDLAGIAVSAGSACSSGKVAVSHVLRAMSVGENLARCALRVSLGWTTTDDEVERFVAVWDEIRRRPESGDRIESRWKSEGATRSPVIALSS